MEQTEDSEKWLDKNQRLEEFFAVNPGLAKIVIEYWPKDKVKEYRSILEQK